MQPWMETPETQNRRLEPTGQAKPSKTRGLTGTGPGLACQDAAGGVFGQFRNQTERFFLSKPGPLVGFPDPLLTLLINTWDIWTDCRRWLRAMPGAPEDDDGANSEMHLEAVVEWVDRWTWEATIVWSWRRYLSEFGDTLGGHDRVNFEMHPEAMIKWLWGCTWRLWSREFGGRN